MKVLAIDTGGTHVKILATGKRTQRQFDSGPTLRFCFAKRDETLERAAARLRQV